jgi:hypothetical protein
VALRIRTAPGGIPCKADTNTINSAIGLGIGSKLCGGNGMPGWVSNSWGFHGDDGNKFQGGYGLYGYISTAYSEPFGTGDTIECCFDASARTISFRKNGEDLGEFNLHPTEYLFKFLPIPICAALMIAVAMTFRQSLRQRHRTLVSGCGHVQCRGQGCDSVQMGRDIGVASS